MQRTKGLVVDHKPARVTSLIEPSVWIEPAIVIEVLADEIIRSPIHTAGKVGTLVVALGIRQQYQIVT